MAVYLYGVGHRSLSPPEDVAGVSPSAGGFRVVIDGELAALVTDLADDRSGSRPMATTGNLAAHEQVVDAVAGRQSFVPARFGVVAESDTDLVAELLQAKRSMLTRTLERLSGRVELRLTVEFEGDELLREALAHSPRLEKLRRRVQGRPAAATYYDRIALGEAAREEVLRLQQRELHALGARLASVVADQRLLTGPDGASARLAYLVDAEGLERFDDELEAYAADHEGQLRLELLGPLAPWDFADLADDPGAQPAPAGRARRRGRRLEGQGAR